MRIETHLFTGTGTELEASHMPGKCATTELNP